MRLFFFERNKKKIPEPYGQNDIKDLQQDMLGLLARHNELVRKVDALHELIKDLSSKNTDAMECVETVKYFVKVSKWLGKFVSEATNVKDDSNTPNP